MRLALVFLALFLLGGCKQKHDPLPEYGTLPAHAVVVSARNLETRGLLWALPGPSGALTSDIPRELTMASVVTVLVHGYNTPPSRVVSYFEGLIS